MNGPVPTSVVISGGPGHGIPASNVICGPIIDTISGTTITGPIMLSPGLGFGKITMGSQSILQGSSADATPPNAARESTKSTGTRAATTTTRLTGEPPYRRADVPLGGPRQSELRAHRA